jgi:hypothetical protein
MLTILKSQFVTQVYVNGRDMGQSIACATPVRMKITDAVRWGQPNEILVRVERGSGFLHRLQAVRIRKRRIIFPEYGMMFTSPFQESKRSSRHYSSLL